MLGKKSQFREAANAGTDRVDTVDLEDDNLNAARIILEIIHLKSTTTPSEVDFDLLYGLTVICDKYDLYSALGPWPQIWSTPYLGSYSKPGFEKWPFIAWTFKMHKECQEMIDYFVQSIRVTTDQHLLTQKDQVLDEVPKFIKGQQQS